MIGFGWGRSGSKHSLATKTVAAVPASTGHCGCLAKRAKAQSRNNRVRKGSAADANSPTTATITYVSGPFCIRPLPAAQIVERYAYFLKSFAIVLLTA
jgi:hypothetical protein